MNPFRGQESVVTVAIGAIQSVDPQTRELRVLVDGAALELLVPPDCLIFLNEERVKLRLLQPQDVVEVGYSPYHGVLMAHAVRVLPPAALPGRAKACFAATS